MGGASAVFTEGYKLLRRQINQPKWVLFYGVRGAVA